MSRVRAPSPAPFPPFHAGRGSQVVRQRSAKPLSSGSNPLRASRSVFTTTRVPWFLVRPRADGATSRVPYAAVETDRIRAQRHDAYGKAVLKAAAGSACRDWGSTTYVDYNGSRAMIDGTVGSNIAVEIESRTGKQVRGAVLDLILHPYPK